jgi:hypothetical protein
VVVEREERTEGRRDWQGDPIPTMYHAVRHIERPRLGTSYLTIVARVKELLATSPLTLATHLIVDATGVGAAVVDMLRQSRLPARSCTWVIITGGEKATVDKGVWHVPKRDLVGVLQVILQGGRLKVAESLPHARTLIDELLSFQVKITESGHDTYGAWREGAHDDLVLATALACWLGDKPPLGPPRKTTVTVGSARTIRPRHWSEDSASVFVKIGAR